MYWIKTLSGKFDYDDPKASDVNRDDVVHALAGENRFANQTKMRYSVLEHSVRVAVECLRYARADGFDERAARDAALCGLWHDAAEAYLKDIPSPLKHVLMLQCPGVREIFERVEEAVEQAVLGSLTLTERRRWRGYVKRADLALLAAESAVFFPDRGGRWEILERVSETDAAAPRDAIGRELGRRPSNPADAGEIEGWWTEAFNELDEILRSGVAAPLPYWIDIPTRRQ